MSKCIIDSIDELLLLVLKDDCDDDVIVWVEEVAAEDSQQLVMNNPSRSSVDASLWIMLLQILFWFLAMTAGCIRWLAGVIFDVLCVVVVVVLIAAVPRLAIFVGLLVAAVVVLEWQERYRRLSIVGILEVSLDGSFKIRTNEISMRSFAFTDFVG